MSTTVISFCFSVNIKLGRKYKEDILAAMGAKSKYSVKHRDGKTVI